mmetsp:Transcript_22017/g.47411  ORF Transcript_22017/g.47411 Transcript_22017/m.47411 type:complete len:153 (-) Transcript_22017:209-667(-)
MSGLSDVAELVVQQVRADDRVAAFRIDFCIYTETSIPDAGTVKPIIHNGMLVYDVLFYVGLNDTADPSVRFNEAEDVAKMIIATAKSHNQVSVELNVVPRDLPDVQYQGSDSVVKTLVPSLQANSQAHDSQCRDVIVSALELCTKMTPLRQE